MTKLHVECWGRGPPVVLVHGAVADGRATWMDQRPLAERWTLTVPDRPGFGENPPVERVDFDVDAPLVAELLADGAHLVGHSYGGVISLLAAARRPEAVWSLTVVEPPAFGVARGSCRGRGARHRLRRGPDLAGRPGGGEEVEAPAERPAHVPTL